MQDLQSPIAKKVTIGFSLALVSALVVGAFSFLTLKSVINSKDRVAFKFSQDAFNVQRLETLIHQKSGIDRSYLLTRQGFYLQDGKLADDEIHTVLVHLRDSTTDADDLKMLDQISRAIRRHQSDLDRAIRMREHRAGAKRVGKFFDEVVMPEFDRIDIALNAYLKKKVAQLDEARLQSSQSADWAYRFVVLITLIALFLAFVLAASFGRQVIDLYDQAKEVTRDREDLLAYVSHDLKNPLSAILMASSMLLRYRKSAGASPVQGEKGSEGLPEKFFDTIQMSAERMRSLIQDLLDHSRLQAGKLSIERAPLPVSEILEEAVSLQSALAQNKNIRLEQISLGDSGRAWVQVDRGRIQQVLSNLIGNAIKFTPPQGAIRVISETDEDDLVRIRIQDTGTGISQERLKKIFDRYWQADSSSREGFGLGLAISKGIVEAHQGKIEVESTEGQGSCFSFTLPRWRADVPGLRMEKPNESEPSHQKSR